jgi:universal stress protein A
MPAISKILVPIDFSPHSAEATSWAVDLARRYDATVTLLHVFQPFAIALPDNLSVSSGGRLAEVLAAADEALAQAQADLAETQQVSARTRLRHGQPVVEIVEQAREGGYDLIVMGTHGRTGLEHALLGSVAEKVVRKAACPVLTVRAATHGDAHPA